MVCGPMVTPLRDCFRRYTVFVLYGSAAQSTSCVLDFSFITQLLRVGGSINSSCSQIHTAPQCSLVLSPLTMATKEETDSPNGSAKREGDTVPYSDEKRPKHTEEKPRGLEEKVWPYIPRCMVWLLEKPEECERSWAVVRPNRTLRTWSSCDFTEKNFKDREEVPGGTTYRQGDTIWFKKLIVTDSGAVIARTSQGFVNFYNRSDAKVRIDWS